MKLYPRFILEELGDGGGGGGGGGFTPSFDGALKPDGSFSEGWQTKAFGPDYKGPLSTAKTFSDVNKMLTDSMAAARAKTDGMVRVPGPDAKPEDIAAFHKALGVPDSENDYTFKLPEGVTDKDLDAEKITAWKKELREAGATKAQAERLISKYLESELIEKKSQSEAFTKSLEAEKAELAKRFPEIDKTIASVKALANRQGVPESLKKAIAGGAFDPQNQGAFWGVDALEVLAWAAKATGEDATRGGGGGGGGMNIAEAKEIMGNPKHPLHEKYMKGDKEVAAKISAAYAAGV